MKSQPVHRGRRAVGATPAVGNAIKFTERGEVTVEVSLDPSAADGALPHFSVTDIGVGIPGSSNWR